MFMMPLWRGHSSSGFGVWDLGFVTVLGFGLGIRDSLGIRRTLLLRGLRRFQGAQETVSQFANLRRERREFVHERGANVSAPLTDERFSFQFRMLAKRDRYAMDVSGSPMPVAFGNVRRNRDCQTTRSR